MKTSTDGIFPSQLRVTQINDEGPIPSFYIRYRDPIDHLTTNWNYISSCEYDLASRMIAEAKVLVVQRSFTTESLWLAETAKHLGIPVIYETDDLMLELPPQSCCKLSETMKRAIRHMVGLADVVTCSTAALQAKLKDLNPNIRVIENYAVPFSLKEIQACRDTTPHAVIVNTDYFKLADRKQELFDALREAILTLGYRVSFLGSVDEMMARLSSEFPSQVVIDASFTPWRKRFLAGLMQRGINVAIVPLEDNVHHSFKSDIKFMDFASVGIPGIFNNRRIYPRVSHQRNGFICEGTFDGWLKGLTYFATQHARQECGDAAHASARERTIDEYANEFADVLMETTGADVPRSWREAARTAEALI